MEKLNFITLPVTSYDAGLDLQAELTEVLLNGTIEDTVVILEHEPIITLGKTTEAGHLPLDFADYERRGIAVRRVNRGGSVTYHGPGQLVAYPILDLRRLDRDVHKYLRLLEQVQIDFLAGYGVIACREDGLTGSWVGGRKIGSVGVAVARWITSHGIAVNINTDLSPFSLIVPCGIAGRTATSLAAELGRRVDMREARDRLTTAFARVFGREPVFVSPADLGVCTPTTTEGITKWSLEQNWQSPTL